MTPFREMIKMSDIEKDESEQLTKSQIKKAMHEIQKIGETLITLSESQLSKIPLPDNVRDAILQAHTLKKNNEAMRRHLQYIGKIMRQIELGPILAALHKIQVHHNQRNKMFHAIEQWRDQLIAQGDEGIQKFLELYPQTDRQQLRQLVRNAKHDREQEKKTGGELSLFRYLKSIIDVT